MSDLDDYLAYLRYERAAAAQTITTYRRLLLQFAAAFPEENLRALDAQTLKDYLLRLTKEHKYSAATLNQHRAALRGYYGWLHCQRGLADDPSTHLKLPRKSKRPLPEVLTPEQITTLLTPPEDSDPLKLRDHAILELFYSAGLRLAELAALNADLPEANGHTIVRGKGGVERLVFIGSKAREALARWRAVRSNLQKKPQETALFLNKNGTRISERGIALRLKAYAYDKIHLTIPPHTLRHTFATHILQSSGDIRAVQEMLGHKNLATTQIYTHLNTQTLIKNYNAHHPRAKKKTAKE